MSSGTISSREEVRYELAGQQMVALTIEPDDHREEPMQVSARLLNLSSSGAKLALPVHLPRDKKMCIRLAVESIGLSFYLSARVCWSADQHEQACTIGCQFTPRIPEGILQQVADGGRLDRRDNDRKTIRKKALAVRSTLLRKIEITAELRDYSAGGVCLASDQPAKLGERLLVRIDDPDAEFDVVVRWQLQQDDYYVFGCECVEGKGKR